MRQRQRLYKHCTEIEFGFLQSCSANPPLLFDSLSKPEHSLSSLGTVSVLVSLCLQTDVDSVVPKHLSYFLFGMAGQALAQSMQEQGGDVKRFLQAGNMSYSSVAYGSFEDAVEENEALQKGPAVRGTCQTLEKSYFRLTSKPDPSSVRPEAVLEKALDSLVRTDFHATAILPCIDVLMTEIVTARKT